MKKLFVLTRNKLRGSSPAVQAGHAVAQFMLDHDNDWFNHTLVYLRVGSIDELLQWKYDIQKEYPEAKVTTFYEPDIDNELTAIAVYGVDSAFFRNLRLL